MSSRWPWGAFLVTVSGNCALCESGLASNEVEFFDSGVTSAWRVRGRVACVEKEGESSVWEQGPLGGDEVSAGPLPIGNEAGFLAAVRAMGVVGVVGVVGTDVIAV